MQHMIGNLICRPLTEQQLVFEKGQLAAIDMLFPNVPLLPPPPYPIPPLPAEGSTPDTAALHEVQGQQQGLVQKFNSSMRLAAAASQVGHGPQRALGPTARLGKNTWTGIFG